MIHIDRTVIPAFFKQFVHLVRQDPDYLRKDSDWRKVLDKLSFSYRRQIRDQLEADFHGKCGYCESPIGITTSGDIDYFRPRSMYGAEAALDWSNLVYSCSICNRNKGVAFPLSNNAHRDEHLPYDERVRNEQPILLNPCVDDPSAHLGYEKTGRIVGLTPRGITTIEKLDLNRPLLVESRKRELYLFMVENDGSEHMLPPRQPYLAIKRVFSLRDNGLTARIKEASQQQAVLDKERENVRTDIGEGLDAYKARPRYIESVQIKNVGAIKNLTLDFSATKSNRIPCFAMLGVNGVGKSTVLKAIAATLAGEEYAKNSISPAIRCCPTVLVLEALR